MKASPNSLLRKVMERIPVATYQSERYCTIHMRELLECGHEHRAYPYGDPLTAKYRICRACAEPSSAIPPKKPAVRALPRERYEPPGAASLAETQALLDSQRKVSGD